MTLKLSRNEVILFGLIVLLLATIALLPWKKLAAIHNETQNSKYGFIDMRTGKSRQPPGPILWGARAEYSPTGARLNVRITNRYGNSLEGLSVHADFTTSRDAPRAMGTLMRRQTEGQFGLDNVRLTRGDWIVGFTGTRHSEFVFRIEQTVKVD
ncbi:MAG: hypothetical protein VX871_12560 [Pseudomonadota bacterium]|nr:hypothetical protein [Pseudomonadota bacterium]